MNQAKPAPPTCAVALDYTQRSSDGSPLLVVTGGGYRAGVNYGVFFTWPYGGVGEAIATADPNGDIESDSWAEWLGTYAIRIGDIRSKKTLATCSVVRTV